MSPREMIEQAMHQIATYKNPDIDDAKQLIHSILQAAKLGTCNRDSIESIGEYGGMIHVDTSWSTRGCAQTSSYSFPASILDASDPEHAAKIWGLQQQINQLNTERSNCATRIANYDKQLAAYQQELESL